MENFKKTTMIPFNKPYLTSKDKTSGRRTRTYFGKWSVTANAKKTVQHDNDRAKSNI